MILPFTITLAANEVRELALQGTRLELRLVPAIIAVIELNDESGGVIGRMEQADATDFVVTSRAFKTVRFTNGATAQTIRFYYGDGDSGSNRFSGVVSGTVALDAATLLAQKTPTPRPEISTGSYAQTAALAANTAHQVFAPGANVSGAIILSASMLVWVANSADGVLIAKAGAAPASITDGEVILSCLQTWLRDSTGLMGAGAILPAPAQIAAGLGLYFIYTNAATAQFQRFCRYRLL